jgi:hypothetical protein
MRTNFWRYCRIPRKHLRISGLRAEFEREASWLLIRGSVDVNKFLEVLKNTTKTPQDILYPG